MTTASLGLSIESAAAKGAVVDLTNLVQASERAERAEDSRAAANRRSETATRSLAAAVKALTDAENRATGTAFAEKRARDIAAYGQELDRLRAKFNPIFAASKAYEAALDELNMAHRVGAVSTQEYDAALADLNRRYQMVTTGAEVAEGAMLGAAVASRQAMFVQRNLSFQLIDIAQSLPLAFQAPLFALQNLGFQMAQIGQIYMGQGGMRAALRDSVAMVTRFARWLGPAALGVGALAAAFAGLTSEINDATEINVTFGDVALATFQALGDAISSTLAPAVDALAPVFASAWDAIVADVKRSGNEIITDTVAWATMIQTVGGAAFEAIPIMAAGVPSALESVWRSVEAGFLRMIAAIQSKWRGFLISLSGSLIDAAGSAPDITIPGIGNLRAGLLGVSDDIEIASMKVGTALLATQGAISAAKFEAEKLRGAAAESISRGAEILEQAIRDAEAAREEIRRQDPMGGAFAAIGERAEANAALRQIEDLGDVTQALTRINGELERASGDVRTALLAERDAVETLAREKMRAGEIAVTALQRELAERQAAGEPVEELAAQIAAANAELAKLDDAISGGGEFARGSKAGGRGGGAAEARTRGYEQLVAAARLYIEEAELEARAVGMVEEAAARLRHEQELLNRATQAQIALTPQQRAEIESLADAMARADTALASAEFMHDAMESAEEFVAAQEMEREALGLTAEAARRLRHEFEFLNDARRQGIELTPEQITRLRELSAEMAAIETETERASESFDLARDTVGGFIGDFRSGLEQGKSVWESFANAASRAIDRIVDRLMNDLLDAIFTVNEAAASGGGSKGGILSTIFSFATSAIGSLFGGGFSASGAISTPAFGLPATPSFTTPFVASAEGNAFSHGRIIPFATGGIVSQPTVFPMSDGNVGLMGEEGEEAILPLRRGADGKLGVEAHGGRRDAQRVEIIVGYSKDAEARVMRYSEDVAVRTTQQGIAALRSTNRDQRQFP